MIRTSRICSKVGEWGVQHYTTADDEKWLMNLTEENCDAILKSLEEYKLTETEPMTEATVADVEMTDTEVAIEEIFTQLGKKTYSLPSGILAGKSWCNHIELVNNPLRECGDALLLSGEDIEVLGSLQKLIDARSGKQEAAFDMERAVRLINSITEGK